MLCALGSKQTRRRFWCCVCLILLLLETKYKTTITHQTCNTTVMFANDAPDRFGLWAPLRPKHNVLGMCLSDTHHGSGSAVLSACHLATGLGSWTVHNAVCVISKLLYGSSVHRVGRVSLLYLISMCVWCYVCGVVLLSAYVSNTFVHWTFPDKHVYVRTRRRCRDREHRLNCMCGNVVAENT